MEKRVVIIVDAANLYLSGKHNENNIWPPDLPSILLPHIEGDINPIIQTHYFTSVNRSNAAQERALNKMRKSGIIVHDYDLKCYYDSNKCLHCNDKCPECGRNLQNSPHQEKMIDIAMATKTIEMAYQTKPHSYDTFIIVSGDKDLIPTIKLIRQTLGKEVIVAGFRHKKSKFNTLAYEMDKEVDKIINFNEIIK